MTHKIWISSPTLRLPFIFFVLCSSFIFIKLLFLPLMKSCTNRPKCWRRLGALKANPPWALFRKQPFYLLLSSSQLPSSLPVSLEGSPKCPCAFPNPPAKKNPTRAYPKPCKNNNNNSQEKKKTYPQSCKLICISLEWWSPYFLPKMTL